MAAVEEARAGAPAAAGGARGRVVVLSGSVGAGHDGVARELARRLRERGHEVDVLDMLDGFPLAQRVLLSSFYVLLMRVLPAAYESTAWLVERSRLVQRVADAVCCSAGDWVLRQVAGADLVVATYPPAGRCLGRLRETGRLAVPVVTYLTDPAPNYLWVHPAVDVHVAPTAATAAETTETYGVPVEVGGPLVSPAFRAATREEARAHLERELGVGPGTRVALVTMGSLGVGDVRTALGALADAGLLPVVLCGRNERLRRRLSRQRTGRALGWRTDVPLLVAGSDLVVHNAGGLSLTEALVAGVPAVTFASIPGHGKANARSLERSGAAPWARSPHELTELAARLAAERRERWPVESETATDRVSALADVSRAEREALRLSGSR